MQIKVRVDSENNNVQATIENTSNLDTMYLTPEQAMQRVFSTVCGRCRWNSEARASITTKKFNGLDLEKVGVKIICKKTKFKDASCKKINN